jgi:aryl-alcohol dehydrogenase-like predicted oxidoreductase
MRYRQFGKTGMRVSEVGFGAWGIGGAYGKLDRQVALAALAKAEELGCNFLDTASVYGDSELVLGDFLPARRDHWLVATKYSGQDAGLIATAESQLKRMGIDTIDFYQIHWAPRDDQKQLYDDLYRLKKSGKARFVGVSLGKVEDIDYVLDSTEIDGFQVPSSLLDPLPLLVRLDKVRERGVGIVVRSTLFGGFLTGKFSPETVFADPTDRRSKWPRENVLKTIASVERFRFLEQEVGSMTVGAARYPLSFPETSTVILGTKTPAQAEMNFGLVPGAVLSTEVLKKVRAIQEALGLWPKGTTT